MRRLFPPLIAPLLALSLAPSLLAQSAEVKHEFSSTIPASGIERVIVEMPSAGITVRTAATTSEIALAGHARRGFKNEKQRKDAQVMVDDSSVEIVVDGTTATVRRKYGPKAQSRTAKGSHTAFEFSITLPESIGLRVRMKGGEIDAAGALGHVDIGLRAGDVKVVMPKSSVKELIARARVGDLNLNLGDRIIEKEGVMAGKVNYLNEGGAYVVSVLVTTGDVTIELTR
ncbi:MAG: hypothetical protein WC538_04055 [Thermoanaerobaculia bacterium]|jgi:hypothetical protein